MAIAHVGVAARVQRGVRGVNWEPWGTAMGHDLNPHRASPEARKGVLAYRVDSLVLNEVTSPL